MAISPENGGDLPPLFDTNDTKHIEKYLNNVKRIAIHVGQKFSDGGDIRHTIEKLEKYSIEEPEPLEAIPSEFKREVWKRQVAEWVQRDSQLKTNIRAAYTLVWG